ncbi:MAG TPA: alpha/beta hydrolase, partial [Streptosporangiaceae bacterium]
YRWVMPLARLTGKGARMSAAQQAELNIELNEIVAVGDPLFDLVTFPMRFVVGEGGALGATEEGHTAMRATLGPVLARNPNVQVSATVASNHTGIVRKDFRAIAAAVREVAGAPPHQSELTV